MGKKMLLLMVGGALGTLARYGVSRWVSAQAWAEGFPWGTLLINVSGSLLLGCCAALLLESKPHRYQEWYLLLGTGVCGGYTTFSTFELETYQLMRDGRWGHALGYVGGSVAAGLVGLALGVALVSYLLPRE